MLKISFNAINDTSDERGLVPSRLVFGILSRFFILNTGLPNQIDRMNAIKTAQAEMNSIVAEQRVLTVLTRNILPAADRTYKLGEEELVFNEDKKGMPWSIYL